VQDPTLGFLKGGCQLEPRGRNLFHDAQCCLELLPERQPVHPRHRKIPRRSRRGETCFVRLVFQLLMAAQSRFRDRFSLRLNSPLRGKKAKICVY
jgi:hypothetical protein